MPQSKFKTEKLSRFGPFCLLPEEACRQKHNNTSQAEIVGLRGAAAQLVLSLLLKKAGFASFLLMDFDLDDLLDTEEAFASQGEPEHCCTHQLAILSDQPSCPGAGVKRPHPGPSSQGKVYSC